MAYAWATQVGTLLRQVGVIFPTKMPGGQQENWGFHWKNMEKWWFNQETWGFNSKKQKTGQLGCNLQEIEISPAVTENQIEPAGFFVYGKDFSCIFDM